MAQTQVTVPDLGGIEEVEVIEISVAQGDAVNEEDTILVLESDKATMEVPAPNGGTISDILVKVGDTVSSGTPVVMMDTAGESSNPVEEPTAEEKVEEKPESVVQAQEVSTTDDLAEPQEIPVHVPDLGGVDNVEVIELAAKEGEELAAEDSLLVLESDKATMEVPIPQDGKLVSFHVKVGDTVSQGDLVATILASSDANATESKPTKAPVQAPTPQTEPAKSAASAPIAKEPVTSATTASSKGVHAGPAVRKLARELGVPLDQVSSTGPRGRILKEDLQAFVKQNVNSPVAAGPAQVVGSDEDFSRFGPIESVPLNKIKQVTAKNMVQSWSTIPQVTQFDEADITELEAYRKGGMQSQLPDGVKVSPLAFIMKACAMALKAFPQFNASLGPQGQTLIQKQYYNIGVAVDTPDGLLVPVVKDADQKGVIELANGSAELAAKARDKKLPMDAMAGGTFTISSLGGIGGTSFTPIVTAPQVAILGVSKAQMKPVWNGKEFEPRLMLPLSMSYDHRVIDGAEAARFTRYLCELLTDTRNMLL